MHSPKIIENVPHKQFCIGCGVCAGVCPSGRLEISQQSNGDSMARITTTCANSCGLCFDVCPFSKGIHSPRELNCQLFAGTEVGSVFDKSVGWYRSTFVGYVAQVKHRLQSASGGLATWCIQELLAQKLVDKVAVVTRQKNTKQLFNYSWISDPSKVCSTAGSVYYPVSIDELLWQVKKESNIRWAIMGLPCLITAMRRASLKVPWLHGQFSFFLGLACGMLQNHFYTQALISYSGLNFNDVEDIRYRLKEEGEPASNYRFVATDRSGKKGKSLPYQGIPFYLGKKAFFRYNACNFCQDVFAESSDVCFMDAWLPQYSQDPKGTSILVIRSKTIEDLFLRGKDISQLVIRPIKAKDVCKSQTGQIKRKQKLIWMRLYFEQGKQNLFTRSFTKSEKLDWLLQKYTQHRSKSAWRHFGQRCGYTAFRIASFDVILVWWLFDMYWQVIKSRQFAFARRVISKSKRILLRSGNEST